MLMRRKTEKGRRDEEDERNEGVKDEEERGCSSSMKPPSHSHSHSSMPCA